MKRKLRYGMVGGGQGAFIGAAQRQIVDCGTDACVANGPAYGKGFSLVTSGAQKHFADAEKLFTALEKVF